MTQFGHGDLLVKMKMLVASTPILVYYNATGSTCVGADVSSYGIGGVLMQDHGGGSMNPVAFCRECRSLPGNGRHK